MSYDRIKLESLHDKVITAEQAAQLFKNGMVVGSSEQKRHLQIPLLFYDIIIIESKFLLNKLGCNVPFFDIKI